jgi:putative transposase
MKVNGKHSSKRLSRLYRVRQRRFRHAVKTMAGNMVKDLYELGVSRIAVGNLKHIREGNGSNRAKFNSMIHNFWDFNHIVQRIKDVAEEYGIKVKEVSEYKTSARCIKCGSENTVNTGRLFKCWDCGLEAHRDTVGVLNIGSRLGESINGVEWDEVGG